MSNGPPTPEQQKLHQKLQQMLKHSMQPIEPQSSKQGSQPSKQQKQQKARESYNQFLSRIFQPKPSPLRQAISQENRQIVHQKRVQAIREKLGRG